MKEHQINAACRVLSPELYFTNTSMHRLGCSGTRFTQSNTCHCPPHTLSSSCAQFERVRAKHARRWRSAQPGGYDVHTEATAAVRESRLVAGAVRNEALVVTRPAVPSYASPHTMAQSPPTENASAHSPKSASTHASLPSVHIAPDVDRIVRDAVPRARQPGCWGTCARGARHGRRNGRRYGGRCGGRLSSPR